MKIYFRSGASLLRKLILLQLFFIFYKSSIASNYEKVETLFFTNEARGLLNYYKSIENTNQFITQIQKVSKKVHDEINNRNRSKRLLHVMRVLNSFHDEDVKVRFAIIKHFKLKELYDLIFLWRQAIYTSSFNGVFDKIVLLTKENKSLFNLLKDNNFEGLNAVIQTCSSYNRLTQFMAFFDSYELVELIKSYANKMDQTKNFYYGMAWVEMMLKTQDQNLLSFMEDYLEKKNNFSILEEKSYQHDFEAELYEDREHFYSPLSESGGLRAIEFYGILMGTYLSFDSLRNLDVSKDFLNKMQKWKAAATNWINKNKPKAQAQPMDPCDL